MNEDQNNTSVDVPGETLEQSVRRVVRGEIASILNGEVRKAEYPGRDLVLDALKEFVRSELKQVLTIKEDSPDFVPQDFDSQDFEPGE